MTENKKNIKISIVGVDNMSGYGNSGVTIFLTKKEYKEIEGGLDYYTLTRGGICELLDKFSKDEYVLVTRFQVFDSEKKIYYEIIEIDIINSSKSYDWNKTYYKKGYLNHPNSVKYELMSENEVKEFNEEWDYMGDNRYYGNDVYSIKNFNLELELKTGYL